MSRRAGRRREQAAAHAANVALYVFVVSVIVLVAAWVAGISIRARISDVDHDFVRTAGMWRVFGNGVNNAVEVGFVVAVATAAYFGVLWALRRGFPRSFLAAIAACVLGAGALLPVSPLASPDAMHLAADVRTLWLHGKYPGITDNAPENIDDPVAQEVVTFRGQPSGYGPVAYAVGGAPVPFVGDGIRLNVFGQKAVAAVALVLVAVFMGLTARRLGQNPGLVTAAVGLNPLMLWQFPGDGHNDAIMAAFGAAALFCLVAVGWRQRSLGLGLAVLSILSKFVLAVAGPVVLAAWFPRLRWLFAALVLVGGGVLLTVFAFQIGPLGTLGPASEIVTTTPWNLVDEGLDIRGENEDYLVSVSYFLFLVLAAVVIMRHPLETPQDMVAAAGLTLFLFLFVCTPGYRPWYQIWYLPVALLSGQRWLIAATLAFSIGAFLPMLALNWRADIARDMGIDNPVETAGTILWLVTAAVAIGVWYHDQGSRLRASVRERPRRAVPRRRAARGRA